MNNDHAEDSLKKLKEVTHALGELHANTSHYINSKQNKTGVAYTHLALDEQVRQIRTHLNKISSLVDQVISNGDGA